jgi:hypothetical protein
MPIEHPRMKREARTIETMIQIYCHDRHSREEQLCPDCADLLEYALARLEKCPFQENKCTCAKCPIHCYKPNMREKVRDVMRYAGPRMLRRHPILALRHLMDGRREAPAGYRRRGKKSAG